MGVLWVTTLHTLLGQWGLCLMPVHESRMGWCYLRTPGTAGAELHARLKGLVWVAALHALLGLGQGRAWRLLAGLLAAVHVSLRSLPWWQ